VNPPTEHTELSGAVSALRAGVLCRCPRCGKGRLFNGYLKVAQGGTQCGLSFSRHDCGDGPAVFVVIVVGFMVVPLALFSERSFVPPLWLHMVIWIPVIIALSLYLLRPFKGVLIALQVKRDAGEGTSVG
tara:strand:+ start:216 stop:605 length:390 start_codon:yes stop_codon:yes gene_type:complete